MPLVPPYIEALRPYEAGRTIDDPTTGEQITFIETAEESVEFLKRLLEIAREVIVCTVTPPAVTTIPTVAASRLPLPPGDKAPLTPQAGGRDVRRSEPRYDSWLGKGQW